MTLEGGEGAGKTSCLAAVTGVLDAAGIAWLETREPGGTVAGERIRALLLDPSLEGLTAESELLLLFAARAQHLAERIAPALAAGTWVVSDRFTDASYAYQGGGRGIAADRIAVLERWVQRDLRPDLTLLLDVPPPVGLARALKARSADRFEQERLAFFERVRDAYRARARSEPERFVVVDASQAQAAVAAEVAAAVEAFVARQRS